jgi:hypothetical protein
MTVKEFRKLLKDKSQGMANIPIVFRVSADRITDFPVDLHVIIRDEDTPEIEVNFLRSGPSPDAYHPILGARG